MSEQATAPPPQQQSAPPAEPGSGLRAAMAEHVAMTQGGPPPAKAAPAQQEAPPQQEQTSQSSAQAGAEQQEAKTDPNKPVRPWDKLGKADEKKVETQEEFGDKPPEGDKAQNAWTTIKKKVKEYETKEQQWARERAEYEQKVKDWESKQNEYKPEILDEWKRYKENEAIDFVQKTTEYQEKAAQPYNQGRSTLKEVSEFTGLPMQQLEEALMEPNSILRDEGVLALLEKSTKEMSDARKEAIKNRVIEAGDKMNHASAEHERLTKEARAKKEQRDNAQKAAEMKAKEESQKVFKQGVNEIADGLKGQLADLVEAGVLTNDQLDGLKNIELPSDPMDIGFGEIAAQLIVPMRQQISKLLKENKELKEAHKERMASNPSVRPSRQNGTPAKIPSLQEAIQAHVSGRRDGGYF